MKTWGLGWKLFVTCWAVYTLHWAPYIVREHYPAMALAESGTLNVERFAGVSEDIFPSPRGGSYINNNPGASLLASVPLLVFQPALRAILRWNRNQPLPTIDDRLDSIEYRHAVAARREWYFLAIALLTVACVMAPVSAASAAALGVLLRRGGLERAAAAGVALLYAFGTPVFFRTSLLNHNLLVGHAGWFALLALWDPNRGSLRRSRMAAAGALGGSAVLLDYSGLVVLAVVALYALVRTRDDRSSPVLPWAAFVAGALPPLLTLAAYQQVAFGSALLPSQHFMRPTFPTAFGYRGFDWPSLEVAWANFFDPRFGLFVYCPVLLLGSLVPWIPPRTPRVPSREVRLILTFFWALVAFSAANRYSMLQYLTGLRYLIPVVPGMFLLSAHVLRGLPSAARRTIIIFSVLSSWLLATAREGWLVWLSNGPAGGIQLSWARRMAELGLLDSPGFVSAVVLVPTAIVMVWLWRRELSCAF